MLYGPWISLFAKAILTVSTRWSEIRAILNDLYQEHRDLDDAITHMAENPATNQLQLRRMKKRKLKLRDQIAYWESKLIPDLDA